MTKELFKQKLGELVATFTLQQANNVDKKIDFLVYELIEEEIAIKKSSL